MRNKLFFFLSMVCISFALTLGCVCQPDGMKDQTESSEAVRINARLPESEIRSEVLKHTPIGAGADNVLKFARTRLRHADKSPAYDKRNPVIRHFNVPRKPPEAVGKRSIMVVLGRYGLNPLLRTEVWIKWAFDENDKLVDVVVEKSQEGL